jgi:hypothetical protein
VPRAIIATKSIATEEIKALFLVNKRVFIREFLLKIFYPKTLRGYFFIPMFCPLALFCQQ